MKSTPASTFKLIGRLSLGVAACLSLYLACTGLGRMPLPGCEAGSACGKALQTPWAFVFGLPVSFPAFLLYSLALLLSGSYVRRERSLAGLEGMAVLAAVVAAAIWFTCLQLVAVSFVCLWCSLIHGFAASGAALLCAARMKHASPVTDRTAGVPDRRRLERHLVLGRVAAGCSAAICVGVLAAGALSHASQVPAQETSDAADYFSPVENTDQTGLALYGGKYHVNPEDLPVVGRDAAGAPAAVLLCDYTSDLCRKYLAAVQSSVPTEAKPVRIIILPAALTPENEDIQRVVMALYLTDRIAWRSLSALITSGQIPAEYKAVERAARKLAGAEKWAEALDLNAYKIAHQIELAASLLDESRRDGKSAAVPVLIHGSRALVPASPDMKELMTFLTNGSAGSEPAKAPSAGAGETANASAALRGGIGQLSKTAS
jgi:uncharacterized membrane protein